MMIGVPLCDDEQARIAALHDYGILDTPPEATFDRLTNLAKVLLKAPMAAVSLVDVDRQWLKSRQGFTLTETPRSVSFCTHAIAADQPFVILDTHADARFSTAPLVVEPPHVRCYIGVPLITPRRVALGALCVYDDKPRSGVAPEDLSALQTLAAMVVDAIEYRRLAIHDSLTRVLTRGAFTHSTTLEFQRSRRHGYQVGCVAIDIDHFKAINDTHGHAVGDMVLRIVADLLRDEVRGSDLVGRVGGEEFAIVLPEIDMDNAVGVAERLRAKLVKSPIDLGDARLTVTASFGVTLSEPGDATHQALFDRADAALYASKRTGRNRVTCWKENLSLKQSALLPA